MNSQDARDSLYDALHVVRQLVDASKRVAEGGGDALVLPHVIIEDIAHNLELVYDHLTDEEES